MRFSLHSVHGGVKSIDEIFNRARRAEELGFEGIFLGDSQLNNFDSFQTLAACALKTERILLGIAVTNMVYRDPTVLAGSAASLNEISKGRAILGMGTGDGPVYGLGRKATPLAKFEEGVKTIRELVQGRHVSVPTGKVALQIGTLPVPVYLSMEGPRGLRLAGRVADGVILGTGFDLRVLQWARERIAEGAEEAGRSLSDIDIIAAGMSCVKKDGGEARSIVRRRLANRAHHNFRFTLETVPPEELAGVKGFMESFDTMKPMEERSDPDLVTDYLVQRFAIAGTPEECITRIRELEKAGLSRVMITPARAVYHETVEALGNDVMPHFRATAERTG
jgi:5,10-methylenetetrahydromethanopterin reductase